MHASLDRVERILALISKWSRSVFSGGSSTHSRKGRKKAAGAGSYLGTILFGPVSTLLRVRKERGGDGHLGVLNGSFLRRAISITA